MSVPSTVKGGYFDVAMDVTSLGIVGITGWVTICGLNTRNITHAINTSDEAVPDCDNPEAVPWTSRNANSQDKQIAGTGLHNRAQTRIIRAAFSHTLPTRFIEGEPGDDLVSQGYWEGPFLFSNWQEGATDKANVTSQFTFVSDGEVDWTDTTANALGTITLAPLVATATDEWTGTVTGKGDNSELSVYAPGATDISIEDNVIKATWAVAGSKAITVTEIDPEATNSPKATMFTVVVS